MKIAWLCGISLNNLPSVPVRHRRADEHPAPVTISWARALRRHAPDVQIEIVTESNSVMRSFVSDTPFGRVHVVRNAYGLPFVPRNIPFRWRVRTRYILSRWALAAAVRRLQPDLVHAHGTEAAYALAALDTGLPHLISMQGIIRELAAAQPENKNFSVRVGVERLAVQRGRNFIAKTPFAERFIHELNPAAHVDLVANPVNPVYLEVNALPGGKRTFLFVGRVEKAKGVDVLLQALREIPSAKLILVGACNTPEACALRAKFGAGLDVEWQGRLPPAKIVQLMPRVDALVLPSMMDTSPNSIIEALCAGLPVIGTSVGGIPDMVHPGRTGWLVPSGSPAVLAAAMRECLDHPERTREMGRQAQAEGRERYAPENAVRRLLAAYGNALDPRAVTA